MSILVKLWSTLLPEQRRAALVLLGLMLLGMLLEIFGISLTIPMLAILTQADFAERLPIIEPLLNTLGHPSREYLIATVMMGLVFAYALKTFFLVFLAWRQARFAFTLRASLSQRLFTGYLRKPYTFHLSYNSAKLVSNIVNEANQFIVDGLIPAMMLLTELLVLFGVGVLLLFIEPLGTLIVAMLLGVTGWSFYRLTSISLTRWGAARQQHDGMRIQCLQQGLGGAKDVKLLGREEDFLTQYAIHNKACAQVAERFNTLQALPRLLLEFLAIAGLAALVISMIVQGKPVEGLITTIGVFAVAAFRLIPSINRMLGALQCIRYGLPVINILSSELQMFDETTTSPPANHLLSFNNSLELTNVTYIYPNAQTPALHNINLSIPYGVSIGFIGASGAGKSTLVDLILGLLTPTNGNVRVDGVDIATDMRGWQNQIGYVPQSIFLTDDTLRRNIAFGLAENEIDDKAIQRALRAAQLETFAATLPEGLGTMVGERGIRLSGGQRQRIGIARALYHDPPVLVLDEATSSLDTATESGVMEAVNALQGKKTILIVAHRLSTIKNCDYVYRLEQGELVEEGKASIAGNVSQRYS